MNQYQKYFQFSDTINGTNYFLRQLLSTVVAFLGGFAVGVGLGQGYAILLILGIIVAAGSIWLSLATMYKRFEALHPNQAGVFTVSLFTLQTVSTGISDMGTIDVLVKLFLGIVGLYLVFANSKIENHEG